MLRGPKDAYPSPAKLPPFGQRQRTYWTQFYSPSMVLHNHLHHRSLGASLSSTLWAVVTGWCVHTYGSVPTPRVPWRTPPQEHWASL